MSYTPPALLCLLAAACGPHPAPKHGGGATDPVATETPVDWSASDIDWSHPPAPGPESPFAVPAPTVSELANGLRVVVVENHRLPLVSAQLIIPGAGSAADPPTLFGLAALTADLLDEGTGKLGPMDVAAELERLGTYLRTSADTDVAAISIDGLSSTLPDALLLVSNLVRAPSLAQADFDRVKADRVSAIRRRRDRPRAVAGLVMDRVLFGAHPYGHPTDGYERTLSAITLDDVREYYRTRYTPTGATLVIAGDVTAADVAAMVTRAFGGWKRRTAPPLPTPAVDTSARPRLVVVDNPGATQSEIRIGRVSITRTAPTYFTARVANTVLGGGFTSRLNRRLREELGYTYGAGSSFWTAAHSGTWTARSALRTDVTVPGLREALSLIQSMRTDDVPAEELSRGKELLVRELPGEFETNGQIAGSFAELASENVALDWFRGYTAGMKGVGAADVRAFADSQWATESLVVVVVGDLSKIMDGLLDLGLGPALELGPEGDAVQTHAAH